MGATPKDLMVAKLFFNAAFPVMQVLMDEDPKIHKKTRNFKGIVQIGAKDSTGLVAVTLIFDNGRLDVVQGPAERYDLALTFSYVAKLNSLLLGGLAVPGIKGKLGMLPTVLSLMMGLKIMTKPNGKLRNMTEKALKVKCSLYMITRALSVYNKLGDPDMHAWCLNQPDRIYQFRVEHGGDPSYIACYLRVKAGKSKSGHGVYTRRTPFVLFRFPSVDGALKVLGKEVEFVKAAEQGYVETVGSPEYACALNDFMAILQNMLT